MSVSQYPLSLQLSMFVVIALLENMVLVKICYFVVILI